MTVYALYKDNDNTFEIGGLKNDTGAFINTATVTLTSIKDSAGVVVTGDTFPKTMAYVAASDAVYRASVDKLLAVTSGLNYTAIVDAVSAGADGHWEIELICATRKG